LHTVVDDATVVARPGMGLAGVPPVGTMADHTLPARMEIIERKMASLESLPGRMRAVEFQIVHLRDEMREQFSTVRHELRVEIQAGDEETRRYMRLLHEEVLARIATIREGRPGRRKS
jgi:hypothetical protein